MEHIPQNLAKEGNTDYAPFFRNKIDCLAKENQYTKSFIKHPHQARRNTRSAHEGNRRAHAVLGEEDYEGLSRK